MAEASSKANPKNSKKRLRTVFARRINLPGGGWLAKNIRAPRPLRAVGGYFAGAYRELREVKWPTRRATWGLTLAVIVFTVVLAIVILLLDVGFEQLFKRIILK